MAWVEKKKNDARLLRPTDNIFILMFTFHIINNILTYVCMSILVFYTGTWSIDYEGIISNIICLKSPGVWGLDDQL